MKSFVWGPRGSRVGPKGQPKGQPQGGPKAHSGRPLRGGQTLAPLLLCATPFPHSSRHLPSSLLAAPNLLPSTLQPSHGAPPGSQAFLRRAAPVILHVLPASRRTETDGAKGEIKEERSSGVEACSSSSPSTSSRGNDRFSSCSLVVVALAIRIV